MSYRNCAPHVIAIGRATGPVEPARDKRQCDECALHLETTRMAMHYETNAIRTRLLCFTCRRDLSAVVTNHAR